jgi:hypothetical protein
MPHLFVSNFSRIVFEQFWNCFHPKNFASGFPQLFQLCSHIAQGHIPCWIAHLWGNPPLNLDQVLRWSSSHNCSVVYCLLFIILCPFWIRESIRRKVNHGGQIDFQYWQHATNLARATVFVVCMSLVRVLVWVRGKAKQKRSLIFCVFGQTRSKCSSSSTFLKSQLQRSLSKVSDNDKKYEGIFGNGVVDQ